MSTYLYGASVQGIQSFIFQTNKLAEIVGASELVDEIFDSTFEKFCKQFNITIQKENIVMSAAGNMKLIAGESDCKKLVEHFPKYIANHAPGITISQAVEEIKVSDNISDKIDELEKKLKVQRNKPAMPVETGFMGLERARRTGGVAYDFDKDGVHRDRGNSVKAEVVKANHIGLFQKFKTEPVQTAQIPLDVAHITKNRDNAWLAIIHADGNGLGKLLSNLSGKISDPDLRKSAFTEFSKKLEEATKAAAQTAFAKVVQKDWEKNGKGKFPIRPVILGGDDMTVIIRADLAYKFTKVYLAEFENKTEEHLSFLKGEPYHAKDLNTQLTACAGIAFVKQNYPFHYGARLAEDLTAATKKVLKKINNGIAPSALNFYKIQASFIEPLSEMKKRTHYAEAAKVSFDYGPYLLESSIHGLPTIHDLDEKLEALNEVPKEEAKGVSKLRQWSSELHLDKNKAAFMMNRIELVNGKIFKKLDLKNILSPISEDKADQFKFKKETHRIKRKSIVNDVIALSSFNSPQNEKR